MDIPSLLTGEDSFPALFFKSIFCCNYPYRFLMFIIHVSIIFTSDLFGNWYQFLLKKNNNKKKWTKKPKISCQMIIYHSSLVLAAVFFFFGFIFTTLRPRSSSSCRSLSSSPPVWTNSRSTGAAASSTTLTWVDEVKVKAKVHLFRNSAVCSASRWSN